MQIVFLIRISHNLIQLGIFQRRSTAQPTNKGEKCRNRSDICIFFALELPSPSTAQPRRRRRRRQHTSSAVDPDQTVVWSACDWVIFYTSKINHLIIRINNRHFQSINRRRRRHIKFVQPVASCKTRTHSFRFPSSFLTFVQWRAKTTTTKKKTNDRQTYANIVLLFVGHFFPGCCFWLLF